MMRRKVVYEAVKITQRREAASVLICLLGVQSQPEVSGLRRLERDLRFRLGPLYFGGPLFA
jgi:hypothetical protein